MDKKDVPRLLSIKRILIELLLNEELVLAPTGVLRAAMVREQRLKNLFDADLVPTAGEPRLRL